MMRRRKYILCFLVCCAFAVPSAGKAAGVVHNLKITVLSTGLAGGPGAGVGEWGYSALVEVDGRTFLYDTGAGSETVWRNARALHLSLSAVQTIILSHNHPDHVGGLLSLRQHLFATNPLGGSEVVAAQGIFAPRLLEGSRTDFNALNAIRAAFEKMGGTFHIYGQPVELAPNVWFTGPVPRVTREHNWQGNVRVPGAAGLVPDTIAEDAALIFRTASGLVILTGCGHAGIVNIVRYARRFTGTKRVFAVVGGVHLYAASPGLIDWTARELRRDHIQFLLAGHCTGLEAFFRLRRDLHLTPQAAAVSAVGSSFSLQGHIAGPDTER